MKFSIIICTYERPDSLKRFLESVEQQDKYPDQILIVDGSRSHATKEMIGKLNFLNLHYYLVDEPHRGLTRQRNFGISLISKEAEVGFFFDDDVVLLPNFFKNQLAVYDQNEQLIGVGGYISNEAEWQLCARVGKTDFEFDGWCRPLGSRNVLRKKLGLLSDADPGKMPNFSHGFSTGYLPPSGKLYQVDYFMGCAMSFRTKIFESLHFSEFFEGYGLYEDMDFCLRASKLGPLYLNTLARLEHYHEPLGRPNSFKYGKMVIRNGWYVWRLKFSNPSFRARFKWHSIALLLAFVRLGNAFKGKNKLKAFQESIGRFCAWFSLWLKNPTCKF